MILVPALFALRAFSTPAPLDKPIAIAEFSCSALTVCKDLSKLTGLAMTCDPRIKDDLLVLVVKQRPAKEVMAKIASTFGWEWLPEGNGFQLAPSDRFLTKAANGRNEILTSEAKLRRQAAKDLLAKVKTQDEAALKKEIEQANNKLQAEFRSNSFDQTQGDQERVTQLQERLSPTTNIALSAIAELDLDQMVRLNDDRLVLNSDPGPLESHLPEIAVTALRETAQKLKAERDRQVAQMAAGKPPDFGGITFGENGQFMLPFGMGDAEVSNADVQLDSWSHATVVLIGSDGKVVGQVQVSLPAPAPAVLPPLDPEVKKSLLHPIGDTTETPPPTSDTNENDPLNFYAVWLTGVAKRLNCDVMSDAYDPYTQFWSDGTINDARILQARLAGFDPVYDSGWLTNRNREWPRYRDEQMPREILTDWNEPAVIFPLSDRASIASRLTPAQLKSPLCPIQANEYWFFRFWSALSPSLRDALTAGKRFQISDFPTSIVPYLYEVGEHPHSDSPNPFMGFGFSWGGGDLFSEPDFVDYTKMISRFTGDPNENDPIDFSKMFTPATDFASLYPARIDPKAPVWMQIVEVPGIYDTDSHSLYHPGNFVNYSAAESTDPVQDSKNLKLARSKAYRLHVSFGEGLEVQQDEEEATLGDVISNDKSKWPKDLLDRIRRRQEIQKQLESAFNQTAPPPR